MRCIFVTLSKLTRCLVVSLLIATINLGLALQIGIVDELAVLNSKAIQAVKKPTAIKIVAQEKDLESLLVQYQTSQVEFSKNEEIMDAKVREQQQYALSKLANQIQTEIDALDKKRQGEAQQIDTLLKNVCGKVAKENNLDMIISNKAGRVLYAGAEFDVTQQVLKALPNVILNSAVSISELSD